MPRNKITQNVTALEAEIPRNIADTQRVKINNIITLYQDRKIPQFRTAKALIAGLAKTNEREKKKAEKKYTKAIEKYEDAQPLSERLKATRKKTKEVKLLTRLREKTSIDKIKKSIRERLMTNKKRYSITYMLFTTRELTRNLKTGKPVNPSFRDSAGRKYYPLFFQERFATVKTSKSLAELVGRRITRHEDKILFKLALSILKTDGDFEGYVFDSPRLHYIDAIKIFSYEEIEGREYNVREENLQETTNISIYHQYIETRIDVSYDTLKEAIDKGHYLENECWFNAFIDHYKDTLMNEKRRDKLTKQRMLELINKTEDDFKTNGASINDMEKVFIHFKMPVRIYDFCQKLIYAYTPEINSRHIPSFYAIVKNNHIYSMNHDLKSIRRKLGNEEKERDFRVSQDYYINDSVEPTPCIMIESINDILKYTDKPEYDIIMKNNDLNEALCQCKDAGYEPYVKFQAGIISDLKLEFAIKNKKFKNRIRYNIKTQNLVKTIIDGDVCVNTEMTYNNMNVAMFNFNKALFQKNHLSFYNETDIKILDECHSIVPSGELNRYYQLYNNLTKEYSNFWCDYRDDFIEIDMSKAFTYAMTLISEIPVFNQFDIWKEYDKRTMDINKNHDLTLYMVKSRDENIFLNQDFSLVYGKFLKQVSFQYEILYYKMPSHVYEVNYHDIINQLWKLKISDKEHEDKKLKKLIANVNIGLLEKGTNKRQQSYIFNSLNECCSLQAEKGGNISVITRHTWEDDNSPETETDTTDDEETDDDEEEEEETDEENKKEYSKETAKYYILNVSKKSKLKNGYRYIKELILQHHNFNMYQAHKKLVDNHVNVFSVKTDAFIIRRDQLRYTRKLLDFDKGLGTWRAEHNKVISEPTQKWKQSKNEIPDIPKYESERIDVVDEWDTETIAKQIEIKNPVMIRAKFAGSGKSYIAKYLSKLGYKVLFVVPTNKLSQDIDDEATTSNKFFSIPVEGGKRLPRFDHSEYNLIVFDEIYMNGLYILNRIREFINDNPEKKYIATGDTKQLPPIKDLTNTQPHDIYADNIIDSIFKYNIYLKICKRLSEKDFMTLENLYHDFWIKKASIKTIIDKYFKRTSEIDISHNHIAYTNERCNNVVKHIRKTMNKSTKYEVGELLICRLYMKMDEGKRFNVNFRYVIENINKNTYHITNIKSGEKYITDEYTLDKHFRHSYCATCHSSQGASINGKITIHEWDKFYIVSREWLWCAITRCVDLNNVYFFDGGRYGNELTEDMIRRYCANKINNYKIQDNRAGREINEVKYIDEEWLMDRMNGSCLKCGCKFEIVNTNGFIQSNMTAQRADNELAHDKDNCSSWCCYCNCSAR